ncbi:MAG: hypothetical protein IJ289_05625 [Clostridia bacterium]|nr:hypothetical protein [Clostridia bacterium]
MKIKNSVQSISADISVVLMCVGILVACPMRIFQMLKNVDPATGFYINYDSAMIIILYAVLALVAVLILVLSYLSGRIPASIAPKGRQVPLAITSLVFALTLFYDSVSKYFVGTQETATIIQNTGSTSMIHHFRSLAAVLAGLYLIVLFISYISGNELYKKVKILSLMPLFWTLARILERITVVISIVRVSELLFEICALVFLMMFFMSFARVMSDVNSKGSMWSVIACGSVAAMFIMTFAVPRLMLTLTGNQESLVAGFPLNWADLGAVLFVLTFVVTSLRKGYSVEDVEKMNAEIEAAKATEEKIQQAVSSVQTIAETGVVSQNGDVHFSSQSAVKDEEKTEN